MSREIILAIETGISHGSLSILMDGSEIDFWIGKRKIPCSEDLLSNINHLFSKNKINRFETKRIAVSTGPGSFTGVRVGIATALGLSRALRCECLGISALEAFALISPSPGKVITAFGIDESEICWQAFNAGKSKRNQKSGPRIDSIDEFGAELKKHSPNVLIVTQDLYRKFKEDVGDSVLIESIENPAKHIGIKSEESTLSSNLLPLYVRDARTS
jgi:tRNA threonylcarbamoyladenosine biosynthesis protein TsaB